MSDESTRRVRIYRALSRPNLVQGGERKAVQTLMALAGTALISNPLSPVTWVVVGAAYVGGLRALRNLAKKDPKFSEVYQRQIRLQPYYPPRRGLDAKRPRRVLG